MVAKRTGQPHEPPPHDDQIIYAIRALATGTANEGQQKLAWQWIVYIASGYLDLSYRPMAQGGDRATTFMEGRRFVGGQMLKLLQKPWTPETKKEGEK